MKKNLTKELVTRENQYSFYRFIGILPNPDKIISRGGRTYDNLRDLKNDPHVWSCIQSRKSGILAMNYKLQGEHSELIEQFLEELDLYKFISDILEAPLFGFQPFEIVWDYRDKVPFSFLPVRLSAKPQEWFAFDSAGKFCYHSGKNTLVPVSHEKILSVFYEDSYSNPYGTSLLSKCYWSCTFKNGGLRFWVNFMERFGMPVLLGQYRRGASESEIQKLADSLAEMSENTVIVAPSDIDIKMEEAVRTSSVDLYYNLIKLCNAEISKAILSQTLTTELDSGSYAASQTHFAIRREVIAGDVKLVENTINRLIRLIFELNMIHSSEPAKFSFISPEPAE